MAQSFFLRFLKGGNPADVEISENSLTENRLHTKEATIISQAAGTALGLLQGSEDALYDQLVTANTYVYGFSASGETDAYFTLELNGVIVSEGYTNILHPKEKVNLWPAMHVLTGQRIKLKVLNTGAQTADFSGRVYIEEV